MMSASTDHFPVEWDNKVHGRYKGDRQLFHSSWIRVHKDRGYPSRARWKKAIVYLEHRSGGIEH
jgi:hypothetical protein